MSLLTRLLSSPRGRPTLGSPKVASIFGSQSNDKDSIAEILGGIESGRLSAMLALADNLLGSKPEDGVLHFARGAVLFGWGRFSEAHKSLLRAADRGFKSDDLYVKLGWTCLWLGRADEAFQAMRRATELGPDNWATHLGLATALQAQKHASESKGEFERALALNPESAHCLSGLILCDIELKDFAGAERLARGRIELNPNAPGAYADLGMALSSQDRHDEAVAAFEHAESLEGNSVEISEDAVNFAICLLRAGRPQHALEMIKRRIRGNPSSALHSHYALALLMSGCLHEGWRQFEFRWLEEPYVSGRPNFLKPQWSGQDLRGRTILLWSEQGLGDFIQFVRYAPHVKALGAKVLVFVRKELHQLAEGLACFDRVLGSNEPYPEFDYYINLLSLPRVFGTDLASIPADVPYLSADPSHAAAWREKIGPGNELKVGIVWAGSPSHLGDRYRSLRFGSLASLLRTPNARFFSLQKGPAAETLMSTDWARHVVDLGPDLSSFADTAGAIDALDLVIGVDTAVVHLAGALGKPVWTLLPKPADWRWLEGREDSPWYPTMRLFRQQTHGDWDEVLARVNVSLDELTGNRNADWPQRGVVAPAHTPLAIQEVPDNDGDLSRVTETRMGIMQFFPTDEVGRSIEFYGEYRYLQTRFLEQIVTSGMMAMEVDAGIGSGSLWLSKRVGAEGHLFIYEDERLQRQLLVQNLKSNRIGNATVMRRRLRHSKYNGGKAKLEPPGDRFGIEVDETIDELRLERLDFLTLNRSDTALELLDGAGETLWRLRPRLFLIASSDIELERFAIRASDFGYACWRAETAIFNPKNFNNRESDIFSVKTVVALIAIPEEQPVEISGDGCKRIV